MKGYLEKMTHLLSSSSLFLNFLPNLFLKSSQGSAHTIATQITNKNIILEFMIDCDSILV